MLIKVKTKKINDKKYYPIYTSQLEMNKDQKVHERTKKVKKIDIRKQSELCLNRIDTTNSE